MTDTQPSLSISQQTVVDGGIILCVAGDLDHHTGPLLEQALSAIPLRPGTGLILEVADLEYCDSTGLTLMIKASHRARAADCSFSLAGPREDLMRVLALTGLDAFFTIHADSAQAVGSLRPAHTPARSKTGQNERGETTSAPSGIHHADT
ncbi:STAS domain-containing protein [Streptomyces sennicomposti]